MESLSDYLLPGEIVKTIEDFPPKMLSHNHALTTFLTYLLFSSPFLAWIGFVLVSTPGSSAQANISNLLPPIICMVVVAVLFYRGRGLWAQLLMETRYVVTNYRLFAAPSNEAISAGKWHGPKQYSDVLFADVIFFRKGSLRGNEYIDLFEIDESYDGHDNTSVTKKHHIFVRSADKILDALPPFIKDSTFQLNAKESADSVFERASAHVRLQRERLGSEYPSISNRMTKRT